MSSSTCGCCWVPSAAATPSPDLDAPASNGVQRPAATSPSASDAPLDSGGLAEIGTGTAGDRGWKRLPSALRSDQSEGSAERPRPGRAEGTPGDHVQVGPGGGDLPKGPEEDKDPRPGCRPVRPAVQVRPLGADGLEDVGHRPQGDPKRPQVQLDPETWPGPPADPED